MGCRRHFSERVFLHTRVFPSELYSRSYVAPPAVVLATDLQLTNEDDSGVFFRSTAVPPGGRDQQNI
jgi:hypothetical protein